MKKQLTQILDLPGVIVKSQKHLEKALVLEVESQSQTARCPTCQKPSHRLRLTGENVTNRAIYRSDRADINREVRDFI